MHFGSRPTLAYFEECIDIDNFMNYFCCFLSECFYVLHCWKCVRRPTYGNTVYAPSVFWFIKYQLVSTGPISATSSCGQNGFVEKTIPTPLEKKHILYQ